jgi:predicted dithiol-disulfide oxidoreductase (DUF899 family)
VFGPEYTGGCPACSAIADGFTGFTIHLEHHDVAMIAVSCAPIAALQDYKQKEEVSIADYYPLSLPKSVIIIISYLDQN